MILPGDILERCGAWKRKFSSFLSLSSGSNLPLGKTREEEVAKDQEEMVKKKKCCHCTEANFFLPTFSVVFVLFHTENTRQVEGRSSGRIDI